MQSSYRNGRYYDARMTQGALLFGPIECVNEFL